MNCRHCAAPLQHVFLDLGFAPASNAYLTDADLRKPEAYFPLKLFVCDGCWLVQTAEYAQADDLFGDDYAYFSSVSGSWLKHAADYSQMIAQRLGLGAGSLVIEVAANDGYLLRNFVEAGIPCLGIEPTGSTADAAEAAGVPVLREFFGVSLARRLAAEGKRADLLVGNNVLAHVPDINDFAEGLFIALKPGGTLTVEFPHLQQLILHAQFDTVYHEHFSYLSLTTVQSIFEQAGLRVIDVETLPTHGGSLRVYACHAADAREASVAVERVLESEREFGLCDLDTYLSFQARADTVKDNLVSFLIELKRSGKRVAAYGAAAKGVTLLNYGGIKPDLLPYVCDAAPSKQGKFLPGSHVPILSPDVLRERRPDTVLVLPWNIADEVTRQHGYVRDWGGQFVVAVPRVRVLP